MLCATWMKKPNVELHTSAVSSSCAPTQHGDGVRAERLYCSEVTARVLDAEGYAQEVSTLPKQPELQHARVHMLVELLAKDT